MHCVAGIPTFACDEADAASASVHVQSFWLGDPGLGNTCSPALYEFASSRGLSITLQN